MLNKILHFIKTINYPSYLVLFVTARCNADCKMCFYKDAMAARTGMDDELTLEEYEKISKSVKLINILGVSGGEPFLRDDLAEVVKIFYRNCSPLVLDLPTNGFFTQKVLEQVEDILKYCKDMVVDIQLSIDGPEKIHNEIRGLKDGFNRVKETYNKLIQLKSKYKNLMVKGCVVYSYYNREHIEELFDILNIDFKDLDRVVFSVAHGSVSNMETFHFNWTEYFQICDKIRNEARVKSIKDFHSIFTLALRMVKNDFLKEILRTKDVYKHCKAGKKVIIINETGKVFPCEELWEAVGDLRSNNYNMDEILNSNEMKEFNKKIFHNKCTCHWGLALSNALIYKPLYYPKILFEILKITTRSILTNKKSDICL